MTTDDRAINLLAEANPVSDPIAFEAEMRTAARLGTIEQWSGTMTETELRSVEPQTTPKNRRPWVVAAVAAVLVLIVGIGIGIVRVRTVADANELFGIGHERPASDE